MKEKTSSRHHGPPFWLFSFMMFPMALGGFVLGVGDIVLGARSANWPVVEGKILSSTLAPRILGAHQPSIRYLYSVNGASYLSSRIWPGIVVDETPILNRSVAEAVVGNFSVGARVWVRVDPSRPSYAVLIPGPRRAREWTLMFFFFLAVGIGAPIVLERFLRAD